MIRRRTHDPERDAALYVSGELGDRARRRFESHLLGCQDCWTEVHIGGRGRRLAEASREIAPPGLRDDVRVALRVAPQPSARWRPLAFASVGLVLIAITGFGLVALRSTQPPAISEAIAATRSGTLPSLGPSTRQPPDLSRTGLRLVMGERVDLAGLMSDAFLYRDANGRQVVLFVSDAAFPTARGATMRSPGEGWQAELDGMTLLCGDHPLNYLVVGLDPSVAGSVERAVRTSGT